MGRKLWFLLLIMILAAAGYTVGFALRVTGPELVSLAELEARSMMARRVNEAVLEEFTENAVTAEELFSVTKDEQKQIVMVQTNTGAVNRLSASLTKRIQSQISGMEGETVEVPLGTALRSPVFSQIGLSFHLRVLPLASAKVNYKTEFETAGVNQTCHKLYLEVNCGARLLAPFAEKKVELSSRVLLAETIVVGDVPQSYIIVPEEKVLDALD